MESPPNTFTPGRRSSILPPTRAPISRAITATDARSTKPGMKENATTMRICRRRSGGRKAIRALSCR